MGIDVGTLMAAIVLVVVSSIVIKYACDSFEDASNYLGRGMAAGVRGATIDAVGSSMPELLTTLVFLFVYRDIDGFSAGVATAAGSAIFNGLIIPSLCILVVTLYGVKVPGGGREKVKYIELEPRSVIRDGFWLLLCEAVLVYFLGDRTLTWVAGSTLMLCYVGYFIHLMWHNKRYGGEDDEDDEDDGGHDESGQKDLPTAILKFDFNYVFFRDRPFTSGSAAVVLGSSIAVLAVVCGLLAKAVIMAATALQVPPYFTAVVLAAAATSVPDTILSLKSSLKGNYDDAVSNAVGSNIFDICVSLGLPLLLFTIVYGSVTLTAAAGETAADVQILRIVLFCVSAVLIASLLAGRRVGLGKAMLLMAMFLGWMTWIFDSAFEIGIF